MGALKQRNKPDVTDLARAPARRVRTPRPIESTSVSEDAQAQPWDRSQETWDQLEPGGSYAHWIRTPLLYVAAVLALVPALLVAVPVFVINTALFGPHRAFFLQQRVGRRGRVYVMFKFRTMRDGKCADDARVTTFGRFLRNTHFDELPQLINVLRGEMCLVGPRPEMLSIEAWSAVAVPEFSERLVLRPGITGAAQISQGYTWDRDEVAYCRKLQINRDYKANLSFKSDAVIIARTVLWMLRRRGWRAVTVTE